MDKNQASFIGRDEDESEQGTASWTRGVAGTSWEHPSLSSVLLYPSISRQQRRIRRKTSTESFSTSSSLQEISGRTITGVEVVWWDVDCRRCGGGLDDEPERQSEIALIRPVSVFPLVIRVAEVWIVTVHNKEMEPDDWAGCYWRCGYTFMHFTLV